MNDINYTRNKTPINIRTTNIIQLHTIIHIKINTTYAIVKK